MPPPLRQQQRLPERLRGRPREWSGPGLAERSGACAASHGARAMRSSSAPRARLRCDDPAPRAPAQAAALPGMVAPAPWHPRPTSCRMQSGRSTTARGVMRGLTVGVAASSRRLRPLPPTGGGCRGPARPAAGLRRRSRRQADLRIWRAWTQQAAGGLRPLARPRPRLRRSPPSA